MYAFIRTRLQVPFLHEAIISTPDVEKAGFGFDAGRVQGSVAQTSPSMGGFVTTVYEAMSSGELYVVVGGCLQAV